MLYPISEIFYSIQGEGYHAGKPAVFIRLAGCNLNCLWCDTDHTENRIMTAEEIVDKVNELSLDVPLIVITGGEPTIHNLEPLLQLLDITVSASEVAIETNGTNTKLLKDLKELGIVDWITLSPKRIDQISQQMVKMASEIKIVFEGEEATKQYETSLELCNFKYQNRLFIQPCSENYQPAVDFVLANPEWRLSVQIQKVIGAK